jgi:hypothetical protein
MHNAALSHHERYVEIFNLMQRMATLPASLMTPGVPGR